MDTENKPELNVVDKSPAFKITFPPLPHSDGVARLVKQWTDIKPQRQAKMIKRMDDFFGEVFFQGGAGGEQPTLPIGLKGLGPDLLSFLCRFISIEWKEYHFNRGFSTRPIEEQLIIQKEIKDAKEASGMYSHLPKEGAEITMNDGTKKTFSLETLKRMVDKNMLPPNPKATKVEVTPLMVPPKLPKL